MEWRVVSYSLLVRIIYNDSFLHLRHRRIPRIRVHVLTNSLTKTSQSGKDTAFDRLIMSRSNVPVSRDGCGEWYPLVDAVAGVVAIGKDPSRKGAKKGTKCGLGKLVIFSRSSKGNFRRHGARSYRAALESETGSQQPAKAATCWRMSSG